MDRFIDGAMAVNHITPENLKSNMDRFIAKTGNCAVDVNMNLKSNMDRFIVQQSRSYVYMAII